MSDFDLLAAKALTSAFARFGQAATYTPPGGAAITCRVIEDKADDQSVIGDVALIAAQRVIEVRASEIQSPQKAGRFRVGFFNYVIVAQPRKDDPHGLVWSCLCRPDPV